MKKIIFITLIFCLGIYVFMVASASETTGTLNPSLETGISGTLRSAPTSSPVYGSYTSNQSVTLTSSGSSAICYTIDGTTPTCASATTCTIGTVYSSAISITSTKTLKSVACYADGSSGSAASGTYTLSCATPTVTNGSVSAYPTCAITCNSGYTLSGSTCSSSGGGGGGGGGGGFFAAPAPANVPETTTPVTTTSVGALQAQLAALMTQLRTALAALEAQGQPIPDAAKPFLQGGYTFTRNLTIGYVGEDVRELQRYLNTHGFPLASSGPGSPGNETTRFGAITRAALIQFQIANGISPASGYFGPLTRNYVNGH